jgi:integrase
MKGDGRIFLRGNVWWADYTLRGQRVRTSTGFDKDHKREANDWLKEHSRPDAPDPHSEKVTVTDLVDQWFKARETNGKSTKLDRYRWDGHLAPFFGKVKAGEVTSALVREYVTIRRAEEDKPENATIHRELSLLRAAFNLAVKEERLSRAPYFPMPAGDNVRHGYITDTQYTALAQECARIGLWLRTLLAMAYSFGFRRGEMLNLRVRQIDLIERIITLDPGTTKNGEGREAGITEELLPLLSACIAGKQPDDLVLTKDVKREGKTVHLPIGDFRKTWASACKAAGVPELLVHDLRRSAARNLRRLGEAEGVIMTIGGWKTRSVFERYNIKSRDDVKRATARLDQKAVNTEKDLAQLRHNPQTSSTAVPANLLN